MSGEPGNRRWEKAIWVLALMGGALAGSLATSAFGSSQALIAIIGVGAPLTLALMAFGAGSPGKAAAGRRAPDKRRTNLSNKHSPAPKSPQRRGQLHAISRHKSTDPPVSDSR